MPDIQQQSAVGSLWAYLDQVSKPVPRVMHTNSLAAHEQERAKLGARAQVILFDLRRNGPSTDRQVLQRLGFTDMNAVRPRINELIAAKLVCVVGDVTCEMTGKTVRQVAAKQQP